MVEYCYKCSVSHLLSLSSVHGLSRLLQNRCMKSVQCEVHSALLEVGSELLKAGGLSGCHFKFNLNSSCYVNESECSESKTSATKGRRCSAARSALTERHMETMSLRLTGSEA